MQADPAGIYLLKVNNRNLKKRRKICSKLTIKTYFTSCSSVSIINFEHVTAGWLMSNEYSDQSIIYTRNAQ